MLHSLVGGLLAEHDPAALFEDLLAHLLTAGPELREEALVADVDGGVSAAEESLSLQPVCLLLLQETHEASLGVLHCLPPPRVSLKIVKALFVSCSLLMVQIYLIFVHWTDVGGNDSKEE